MKIPIPWRVLRAVVEYVEEEAQNIEDDIENKGILLPVLKWLKKEGAI